MVKEKTKTTVDLTEVAKKIKAELAPKYGLRGTLSAGLVALSKLSADDRERAVAEAKGIEAEPPGVGKQSAQPTQDEIDRLWRSIKELADKLDVQLETRPAVSAAADAVKYATVHYKLLSKEDKEAVDELRRILGPKPKFKRKSRKA